MVTEELVCRWCGDSFTRERLRGRKPHACPNCVKKKAQKEERPVVVELVPDSGLLKRLQEDAVVRTASTRGVEALFPRLTQEQREGRLRKMLGE